MAAPETIGIVLYMGGKILQDKPYSFRYDRHPAHMMRISRNTNFIQLLSKLYEVTGINSNDCTLRLSAKYLSKEGSWVREMVLPVKNDNDVKFFLEPEAGIGCLELFIEIKRIHRRVLAAAPVSMVSAQGLSNIKVHKPDQVASLASQQASGALQHNIEQNGECGKVCAGTSAPGVLQPNRECEVRNDTVAPGVLQHNVEQSGECEKIHREHSAPGVLQHDVESNKEYEQVCKAQSSPLHLPAVPQPTGPPPPLSAMPMPQSSHPHRTLLLISDINDENLAPFIPISEGDSSSAIMPNPDEANEQTRYDVDMTANEEVDADTLVREGATELAREKNNGEDATTLPKPKRAKTSTVWLDFKEVKYNGATKISCIHCQKMFVKAKSTPTTQLHRHLKSCAKFRRAKGI